MVADNTEDRRAPRFVDPTVDPSVTLDFANGLLDFYGAFKALQEVLRRFPNNEYAVGFDGVDDWVCVEEIDLGSHNLDIESRIWSSQPDRNGCVFDVLDRENSSVIGIASVPDGESFRLHYRTTDGVKTQPLPNLNQKTWQNLRIWSSGRDFSVTVDGNQVAFVPDIDLTSGPYKLYFGGNPHRITYFEGMVRYLKVRKSSDEIFSLKSGNNLQIQDKTNSATTAGIHKMKKGRFQTEFRSIRN